MQRHRDDYLRFHLADARTALLRPDLAQNLGQRLARVMFTPQDQLPQKTIVGSKPDRSLEMKRFLTTTSAAIFHQGVRSDRARTARTDGVRVSGESLETRSTKMGLAVRHLAAASMADRRVNEMKEAAR